MIFIQAASGKYADLLRLVQKHHQRYCDLRGIEYVQIIDEKITAWSRYKILQRLLDRDPYICYADADVLVTGRESIADALAPGAALGMVMNRWNVYNSGIIWCRAAAAELLGSVEKPMKYDPNDWKDQARLNEELHRTRFNVQELDSRWNSYRFAESPPTLPIVIEAWHGSVFESVKHNIERRLSELGS
jgi:hypothetical protein